MVKNLVVPANRIELFPEAVLPTASAWITGTAFRVGNFSYFTLFVAFISTDPGNANLEYYVEVSPFSEDSQDADAIIWYRLSARTPEAYLQATDEHIILQRDIKSFFPVDSSQHAFADGPYIMVQTVERIRVVCRDVNATPGTLKIIGFFS